ncbi:hypothetical protein [Nibribacter koreensis]|uniref:Uncharacterized protein n=1 Tax=Nibribacter koreensis TaxID=1084519 RepID=A0ABP8FWH2_9BACT
MDKRQRFLEAFLGALGASQLLWNSTNDEFVSGTVIYDIADPEERQDFILHKTENEVPDEDVITLLAYLKDNELLDGDKLKVPDTEISLPTMDDARKERAFEALFTVLVSMVDEGEETDCYYIHD